MYPNDDNAPRRVQLADVGGSTLPRVGGRRPRHAPQRARVCAPRYSTCGRPSWSARAGREGERAGERRVHRAR